MPQSQFWPYAKNIKTIEDGNSHGESSVLQRQLGDMEGEVKEIQMELAAIKKDRLDIVNRKQKKITGVMPDSGDIVKSCGNIDASLRFTEIGKLREELVTAKNAAEEEKRQREKYEEKLKDLEQKLNSLCSSDIVAEYKESRLHSCEEKASLKSQLRDANEELEELKFTIAEKSEQLQEYRMRYLQAQQQLEETKRQVDVIEFDNKQVSDQIQIEIQKMKMQFQEKLQELAPLPDLLKGAQIQLQEAKQLQKLAEDSSQQLSNELYRVKEKLVIAVNSFNHEKSDRSKLADENVFLKIGLDEKQKEVDSLSKEVEEYKSNQCRLEEKLSQVETRFKEKALECTQVLKDLNDLRAESSRSLNRCKDRNDSMRRHLQMQVSELERQLVQSRAQCRACQKERDETRQRVQVQINNLQENFELVEIRLRAIQSQVSSLKNSYTVILADEDEEFNKITPI